MKATEFIDIVNNNKILSLDQLKDFVDTSKLIFDWVNVTPHKLYISCSQFFQCEDAVVNVTGPRWTIETQSWEDINDPCTATLILEPTE